VGFLILCWWRAVETEDVFLSLGAGALGTLVFFVLGPPLRALVPHLPGFAPFNAGLFLIALPQEALKLAGLYAVSPKRVPLIQATGVACGFAAAENVLTLAYAPDPTTVLTTQLMFALPTHLALAAIAADVLARCGLGWRGYAVTFAATLALHTLVVTLFFANWLQAGMAIIATAFLIALGIWRLRLSDTAA
jgi:hypothetical protein